MDTTWFIEHVSVAPLLVGVALCVAGWTLYWGGLNLIGAIVGVAFGLGVALAGLLLFLPPKDSAPLHLFVLPIAAVVGLYLGTRFFRQLHRLFFFFIGALVGVVLCAVAKVTLEALDVALFLGGAPWVPIALVIAIVSGVVMVWLSRYCIVIITSLAGTHLLLQSIPNKEVQVFFIPVFLTSVAIQTGFVRALRLGAQPESDDEEEK